jgi:hypothetical protein
MVCLLVMLLLSTIAGRVTRHRENAAPCAR